MKKIEFPLLGVAAPILASRPNVANGPFFLSFPPPIHPLLPNSPPALLSDMLVILSVAGALLFYNALALTTGSRNAPQVVLSGHESPTTIPDVLEDVDISEGWADPRINSGRFLDVRCIPVPKFTC